MRYILAGADFQEKKNPMVLTKIKFAMVLFGFTLGEISKTCQSNYVVIW